MKGEVIVKRLLTTLLCAAVATLTFSCKKTEAPAAAAPPAAQTGSAPAQMPPGHPNVDDSLAAATGKPGELVTGKVLEAKNSAGFTYVKLQTSSGEVWAALPQAEVKTGADLTIVKTMTTEKFESKSLGRTFDKLIFGTIPGAAAMPSGHGAASGNAPDPHENVASMGGMPHGGGASAEAAPAGPISVAKAEGGRTVAEIWSGKASLKDKPVAVRGKVVKFNAGIMGRNWIHLRDGSGTEAKGDHDITVTTTQTAKVGEVVLVNGTVRTDKDFGAGYAYAVIVEDAKLSSK
jgi:hypothetical protein